MSKLDLKTIGARIKGVREENKLTQEEFGKVVGVNMKTISLMENGHRKPSQEVLSIISSKYNINLDWVSTGNGERISNKKSDPKSIDNLLAKITTLEFDLAQMRKIMEEILAKLK